MKALEKKRLVQGGELANDIDTNLMNISYIQTVKVQGNPHETLSKLKLALEKTHQYCKLMGEEFNQRELLISELKKEIEAQELQRQQLDAFKQSIETIQNELKSSEEYLKS